VSNTGKRNHDGWEECTQKKRDKKEVARPRGDFSVDKKKKGGRRGRSKKKKKKKKKTKKRRRTIPKPYYESGQI